MGVADRNGGTGSARLQREISPEKPNRERTRTPGYALQRSPHRSMLGLALRNQAGAIALAVLKRAGDRNRHRTLTWSQARSHRGIALMSVPGNDPDVADIKLYYALTPHALLFSLNPAVLEVLIDQFMDNKRRWPSGKPDARDPQLVVDLKDRSRARWQRC